MRITLPPHGYTDDFYGPDDALTTSVLTAVGSLIGVQPGRVMRKQYFIEAGIA